MQLDKLINWLLPSFGKDRITEDLRITKGEIESLQTAFDHASQLFRHWKFKSETIQALDKQFAQLTESSKSDNLIVSIDKAFPVALKNLAQLEDLVLAHMGKTVAGKAITYKQATLIQYADAMYLFSKYARKLLNYILVKETEAMGAASEGGALKEPDVEYIDKHFLDFCYAFKAITGKPERTLAAIEDIPEAQVTSASLASMKSSVGITRLDPLKMGFLGTRANPIYFFRVVVADFQMLRYKAQKEELTLLQLRKLNLERLNEGKQDAKVQKQIEYYQARVDELDYELRQREDNINAA